MKIQSTVRIYTQTIHRTTQWNRIPKTEHIQQQEYIHITIKYIIYKIKQKLTKHTTTYTIFDVLLTVHLSIFISVFNQLDAKNLFHNKFYFMPLHVSSTCAHHQMVKITLHSLWYHLVHEMATYRFDDTRGCVKQFWPPDDEHMCSKHVEA